MNSENLKRLCTTSIIFMPEKIHHGKLFYIKKEN